MSDQPQPLVQLDWTKRSLSFTGQALALREEALGASALISRVSTPEENQAAVEATSAQRRFLATFEAARVEAKKPAWEEGKRIDAMAAQFVKEVEAEVQRVGGLMGSYVTLLEAKRRDEELARRRDLDELERQKRAELAKAETHEEREQTQARFENLAASVPATAPLALPKGQSAKRDWEFEVLDARALYLAYPEAVELTPRPTAIKALLEKHNGKLPGVKAEKVTKAAVRPAREGRAIEIGGGA